MARSFTLGNLSDDKGLTLSNVRCVAYRLDTHAEVETQYTDANGDATFTTLPDSVDCIIFAYHHQKADRYYSEAPPTMDEVYDGGTYGKVLIADLDVSGHITLSTTIGDLDDIDDGTTHGKILNTDISAGHIKLTSTTVIDGEWYNESGVEIDASHGINIYGTANALTTRATKTGTIQCYVGSDGKIYAGAGSCYLDTVGLTFTSYTKKITFTQGGYTATVGSLEDGTLKLDGTGGVTFGRVYGNILAWQDGVGDIGSTSYKWNACYIENPRFDIVRAYGSNKQIGIAGTPWTKAIITTIEPDTDEAGYVGTAGKRFNYAYIKHATFHGIVHCENAEALRIPVKGTTGDPAGVNGLIYANLYDNKIRCYADGAYRDLATW